MLTYQYKDETGNKYMKFRSDRAAKRWFLRMWRDTVSTWAMLNVWEAGVPLPIYTVGI